MRNRHQLQPMVQPVTSDGARRLQLALEAQIVAAGAAGVTTFNNRSGVVVLLSADVTDALGFTPQALDTQLTDLAGLVYPANAGKVVTVNAGATGFALIAPSGGSSGYTVTTQIAAYTEAATSGEVVRKCDLAAGFTVTLPTAVGNTAKLSYKKMLAAGAITIDGAGTETIDGGLTAVLNSQYESITIVSDNANWILL